MLFGPIAKLDISRKEQFSRASVLRTIMKWVNEKLSYMFISRLNLVPCKKLNNTVILHLMQYICSSPFVWLEFRMSIASESPRPISIENEIYRLLVRFLGVPHFACSLQATRSSANRYSILLFLASF